MGHEKFKELLSDARDGLLSVGEREELDAHLAACGDCRRTAARWEEYGRKLFAPLAKPTPAETDRFTRIVMARIRQEADPVASWWKAWSFDRWLVPALSLGVAAAALFIALAPVGGEPAMDEAFLLSKCNNFAKWCVRPSQATVNNLLMPPSED